MSQRHGRKCPPPGVDGRRPDHDCQGRFQGRYDVTGEDGRRRRVYVYGPTREAAEAALAAAIEEAHG